MRPESSMDELSINMLKVLANDYRKKAKLTEVREQNGIRKVQERLQQLKAKDLANRKAKKDGTYVE